MKFITHLITRYFRFHFKKVFRRDFIKQLEKVRKSNELKRIKRAKKAVKKNPNVSIPFRKASYQEIHQQVFKGLVGLYTVFQHEGMKQGLPFKNRVLVSNWKDLQKAIRNMNSGLVLPKNKIKEVLNTFIADEIIEMTWQQLKKKESKEKHYKFKIEFSNKFKMPLVWKARKLN
ncbi:MAG: hypothetical protein PF448_06285 [Bacteroidales bacterium]|jgi:hypothetical protein|nr:hypothetical protein [Bacteroidales bacterium]